MNNQFINNDEFDLFEYFDFLDLKIQNILLRPVNNTLTYDILDTQKSKINKYISLKERQRQMKIGEIWQEVLGNYNGCINLKIGHETGLDIVSHTRRFIIELKNRTNTDNSSFKKANFDKLSNFKKNIPIIHVFTQILTQPHNIKQLIVVIKK